MFYPPNTEGKPIAVASMMINNGAFYQDWSFYPDKIYHFLEGWTLPYSEGEIDEETFLKYGIVTSTNYRDAILRGAACREAEVQTVR